MNKTIIKNFGLLILILFMILFINPGSALSASIEQGGNIKQQDSMKISKLPDNILEILKHAKRYSDMNDEEKKLLCKYFEFQDKTLMELDKKGYMIIECINIGVLSSKYEMSIEDIEKMLSNFGDINKVAVELSKLNYMKAKEKPKDSKINTYKKLLSEGYSIEQIKSSFIVADATGIDEEKLIRKEKKLNEKAKLDSFSDKYAKREINMITNIYKNYFIDIDYLLDYVGKEKISLEEVQKKVVDYEISRASLENRTVAVRTIASVPEGEQNTGDIKYDKYFNPPFNYRENNNESIYPGTGSLTYESQDLILTGRNGLDVKIVSRYESDKSNLYNPNITAGVTYVDEYDYDYPVFGGGTGYFHAYGFSDIYGYNNNNSNAVIWEIGPGLEPEFDVPVSLIDIYDTELEAQAVANSHCGTSEILINADPVALEKDYKIIEYYAYYESYLAGIYSVPYYYYNDIAEPNTYQENRNGLGSGWSFGFSSIETDNGDRYLHLGNGQVYKINITSTEGDSNLDKYTLKDMRMETDSGSYNNGEKASAYVLIYKNGGKEYFADDGRLLAIGDRYGNTIKFNHIIINGYAVISQITDTMGRIINIAYNTTPSGKEVVITAPDNTTVKYMLESVSGSSNEYVLKKKIDQKNRETIFDYSIDKTSFSFTDKTYRGTDNYFANLSRITYPTNAVSSYNYEKTIGNLGSNGSMEYYRIKTREDIDKGASYNKQTYNYQQEYTGYPAYTYPGTMPDSYTYTTAVTDSNNTANIYTFNNKHLLSNKQVKENNSKLLRDTVYEYDANKLPVKETTTSYGSNGAISIKQTASTYNEFGVAVETVDELGHKTTYRYDSSYHLPIDIIKNLDPSTVQRTVYEIDPATGNIKMMKKVHAAGGVDKSIITSYGYDAFGNITSTKLTMEDGREITRLYKYDDIYKGGYLTETSATVRDYEGNPQEITERYTYDFNNGNKLSYENGNGKITFYKYDPVGRLVKETNPDGTAKNIVYNDAGKFVDFINENQFQTRNIYDGLGRLVQKQENRNGVWVTLEERSYNAVGQLECIKDGNGNQTSYAYDSLGRATHITNPDSTYTLTSYDDGQNLKIEYNEEGEPHYFYYDNSGNLIRESVFPDKNNPSVQYSTVYTYNYAGEITAKTDANGNKTRYGYDDLGRLLQVTDALNQTTCYEYDNMDNIIRIKTAGGSITQRTYDEQGRLIVETDPANKSEYMRYDGVGNLTENTDRNGVESELVYDDLNRLKMETKGSSTTEYTYDNAGYMLTAKNSTSALGYEYYEDGKLKKETMPDGKYIYYEYDNNGNRIKTIDHFGKETSYGYDSRNRLKTVSIDNLTTTYEYNNDGSRKSITYPNGVREEYYYDGINNLLSLINKKADGTIINQFSYTYDPVGNQKTKMDIKGITTYTYDALNHAEKVMEPNSTETSFLYDSYGNISNKFTEDSITDETDLNYSYSYNCYDQLTGYENSDKGIEIRFDYYLNGLRHAKYSGANNTAFYYDNQNVIIETINGNLSARNIFGIGLLGRQDSDGSIYYYLYNGHGDVVTLIDKDGNVVNSYDYDIYGNIKEISEDISNPIMYAGQYFDNETELYYLRARYYDPGLMRFISPDTHWNQNNSIFGDKEYKEGEVKIPDIKAIMQSSNLYAYSMNNPLFYIDPTGCTADDAKKGYEFMMQVYEKFPGLLKNNISFETDFGTRIPDIINNRVIGEIKNVKYQYLSSQIKGFLQIAQDQGKQFVLIVKKGTKLSGPLIKAIGKSKGRIIELSDDFSKKSGGFFIFHIEGVKQIMDDFNKRYFTDTIY